MSKVTELKATIFKAAVIKATGFITPIKLSLSAKSLSFKSAKLSAGVLAGMLITSCASFPVGNDSESTASNMPTYPTGYGVPVTERTVPQRLLDRSIEHTASVNIKALDSSLPETSRFSIDSFYSEVLLTGEVPTEALKEQITAIVRSMPDVRKVYDELKVGPMRGYSSTVQDGYITSKFMAKVLANQEVKSSQVKAVTDNGVVYIMGRMTPTQQSHLIDIANGTVGITELVLLTTLVNDAGEILTEQDVMQESNLDAPTTATSAANSQGQNAALNNPVQPAPVNSGAVNSGAANSSSAASGSSPYIDLYRDQVAQ